jgi:hypothetical protein
MTAAYDPKTGARYLPPVMFVVLVEYRLTDNKSAFGFHGDPLPDLDAAADQVAEVMKDWSDHLVTVLRITDTLNCDDVTADVLDTLRLRLVQRRDAERLENFDEWVAAATSPPSAPRDWAPSPRFGDIREYPNDDMRLTWADLGIVACVSFAGASVIYALCLIVLALLP